MRQSPLPLLKQLHQASLQFLFPLGLTATYKLIITQAMNLTGCSYGSIWIRKGRSFERVFSNTPSKIQVMPLKKGRLYQVYSSGKPLIYSGKERNLSHPEQHVDENFQFLIVPIRNEGRSIGAMTLDFSGVPKLGKNQLFSVCELFGASAALAVRKAQLYEDLRNTLHGRDLFIAIAAHELRTPLTTIAGSIQLIQHRLQANKVPKNEWVDLISEETRRMTRLVNELLAVQQIAIGKFQYDWQNCDLKEILERTIQDMRLSFPQRKFNFKNNCKGTCQIWADADKLLQVFTNIIVNANRYSPDDKSIDITLSPAIFGYQVIIADYGTGMGKRVLAKIFEGFYTGGTTKHGLGLGLYVSKRIIDRHEGKIFIESALHQGTKVMIELPAYQDTNGT